MAHADEREPCKRFYKKQMRQGTHSYNIWIGGSCDYGHKERAGGAAAIIEQDGNIVGRSIVSGLHTTEFRMILTVMAKVMNELPDGSDILFMTNVAYIKNACLDRQATSAPEPTMANYDLIRQCAGEKERHGTVSINIVKYHKSRLLAETHDMAKKAMEKIRNEYHRGHK